MLRSCKRSFVDNAAMAADDSLLSELRRASLVHQCTALPDDSVVSRVSVLC